ncbi:MAG: hypothetical protein IJT97_05665 [Bacteroidaceae bacterium]|nr:hypothetical protein [Bacteroidaceae bacterium]
MGKFSDFSGRTLPFPWQSIAVVAAQFCCCGDTALLLRWENFATPAAQFSHDSGTVLSPEWENLSFPDFT